MTLKLIDKDLKSKYAEVLYKNEVSYDKELDRRFRRLNMDFTRNSQMVDAGSQVFLNKIRQKRTKWINDDLSFRDHYRLVCRNVTNKKFENLKQAVNSNLNNNKRNSVKPDPVIESKLNILKEQLVDNDSSTLFSNVNSELNFSYIQNDRKEFNNNTNNKPILIPKLPSLKNLNQSIDEDLYSKYSKSDRDFLDKFPAKVELTITDVGKQFLFNEIHKNTTLQKQMLKNNRLQNTACKDSRFKELVNYLN